MFCVVIFMKLSAHGSNAKRSWLVSILSFKHDSMYQMLYKFFLSTCIH